MLAGLFAVGFGKDVLTDTTWKDTGFGSCRAEVNGVADGIPAGHDYWGGIGDEGCRQKCEVATFCAGYSVSEFNNCMIWLPSAGQVLAAGGSEYNWGKAHCIVRDPAPVPPPAKTSAPTKAGSPVPPKTLTWKDVGFGSCRAEVNGVADGIPAGHDYWGGVGDSGCRQKCEASYFCAGYSVSEFTNCMIWIPGAGQVLAAGGSEYNWGKAHCILKDPAPVAPPAETGAPTAVPAGTQTSAPTAAKTIAPAGTQTGAPTPVPTWTVTPAGTQTSAPTQAPSACEQIDVFVVHLFGKRVTRRAVYGSWFFTMILIMFMWILIIQNHSLRMRLSGRLSVRRRGRRMRDELKDPLVIRTDGPNATAGGPRETNGAVQNEV